jgi:hypothetical protein
MKLSALLLEIAQHLIHYGDKDIKVYIPSKDIYLDVLRISTGPGGSLDIEAESN